MEHLWISYPLLERQPTSCPHTLPIDDDLLGRIKEASDLTSVDDEDSTAKIRELVGDADEPVYHIRVMDSVRFWLYPTDFTSYKGAVVPIDILRMMYRRSGFDIAAQNDQRRIPVEKEAFCFMKSYMQIMSKEDIGKPCDADQEEE